MENLENYIREKKTIDIVKANIYGVLITIPIAIIFVIPYLLIWGNQLNFKSYIGNLSSEKIILIFVLFSVSMILGIVLHELIHGLTWAIYAKNGFKSMKFGVLWNMLTPYCHCKEPLKVKHYIFGALTPAIILGILPSIISIVIGSVGLLVFGMFFTIAACGDFLVINLIRKENPDDYVQDHPSEAGCYIYRKIL